MRPKGFTLIELLIIIGIVTILASVAIPTYIRTVEKARSREAITNLRLIYGGQKIHEMENGTFTTGTLTGYVAINIALGLDIEPQFWAYEVVSPDGGVTYTATTTRDAPGSAYDGTITLNQAGIWGGTHPFFVPSN